MTNCQSLEKFCLLEIPIFNCITGKDVMQENGLLNIYHVEEQSLSSRICQNRVLFAVGLILQKIAS